MLRASLSSLKKSSKLSSAVHAGPLQSSIFLQVLVHTNTINSCCRHTLQTGLLAARQRALPAAHPCLHELRLLRHSSLCLNLSWCACKSACELLKGPQLLAAHVVAAAAAAAGPPLDWHPAGLPVAVQQWRLLLSSSCCHPASRQLVVETHGGCCLAGTTCCCWTVVTSWYCLENLRKLIVASCCLPHHCVWDWHMGWPSTQRTPPVLE